MQIGWARAIIGMEVTALTAALVGAGAMVAERPPAAVPSQDPETTSRGSALRGRGAGPPLAPRPPYRGAAAGVRSLAPAVASERIVQSCGQGARRHRVASAAAASWRQGVTIVGEVEPDPESDEELQELWEQYLYEQEMLRYREWATYRDAVERWQEAVDRTDREAAASERSPGPGHDGQGFPGILAAAEGPQPTGSEGRDGDAVARDGVTPDGGAPDGAPDSGGVPLSSERPDAGDDVDAAGVADGVPGDADAGDQSGPTTTGDCPDVTAAC